VGTEVLPPDLELWATAYARAVLPTRTLQLVDTSKVKVSNKEPAEGEFPDLLVVFRDDGGPMKSIVSGTRTMGISVLAGTRKFDVPARELARLVFAIFTDQSLPLIGGPDCPVVSVDGSWGPYPVTESQDRTRMYSSVEYTVVGSPVD